eukprot:SAG31_NODE_1602_length_7780_cov_8.304699_5_plen_37_part_00
MGGGELLVTSTNNDLEVLPPLRVGLATENVQPQRLW